MERREKVLIGIAVGAVVGLLALAAPAVIGMIPTDEVVAEAPTPTVTPSPELVETATPTPTPEPVATSSPTPTPVESACLRVSPGEDRGATYPGADGSVEKTNGDGLATVYRVASNDSYWAILDRFCVDGDTFDNANGFAGAEDIYEGDYLAILPEGAGDAAALNEAANGGYRTHQDCDSIARIELSEPDGGRIAVSLSGQIVDSGKGEYAEGPVENVDGVPTYYTVQPGDTYRGIGDRFCVDSITVQEFNDGGGPESILQPGDRVQLRPTSGSIEYQG